MSGLVPDISVLAIDKCGCTRLLSQVTRLTKRPVGRLAPDNSLQREWEVHRYHKAQVPEYK